VGFAPGDRVHVVRLGTGVVREVRNGDKYVIEIKGRTMIVAGAQMEGADPLRTASPRKTPAPSPEPEVGPEAKAIRFVSLDLHGKTVEEAIAALDEFLDAALIASHAEVRIIHGRSGGRIRDAVHTRLRQLPPVRSFRIDPRNPGVTIVSL
jgi:dsDNA-specific endonuclease/ATPase MutS2